MVKAATGVSTGANGWGLAFSPRSSTLFTDIRQYLKSQADGQVVAAHRRIRNTTSVNIKEKLGINSGNIEKYRGWEWNHESWIILTKHVRTMNLCFKNSGIVILSGTSARDSWITRLWEKLNKIPLKISCVWSRECRIWRFSESNSPKFFPGSMPQEPPI